MTPSRALQFAILAMPPVRARDEPPTPDGEPDRESLVKGRLVKAARRSKAEPTDTTEKPPC